MSARSDMEAAFRRNLPLPSDKATAIKLGRALDRLELIAVNIGPTVSDAPFRQTDRKTARAELDRLAKLLEAAATYSEKQLHAPAIDALADLGIMRTDIRKLAATIRRADVSHVAVKAGRGTEQGVRKARLVAKLLYDDFKALTGRKPTIRVRVADNKATGPYLDLLRDLFGTMKIRASAESVVRATIEEKREREKAP